MRTIAAAIAAATLAANPAAAADRSFPVTGFTSIVSEGAADVDVRTGVAPSLVATGDAQDLERLDIRVEDNVLRIGTKRGMGGWSYGRKGVRIAVTTPSLAGAVISGSGDMSVDRVRGPFSGRISGSGDMTLPSLQAGTLALAISGSGTMQAAGSCTTGSIKVSGSGNVDAASLECGTLEVAVTGSGNVSANATKTAALSVTGSGNIRVAGGARCTTATTGSGTIRCG